MDISDQLRHIEQARHQEDWNQASRLTLDLFIEDAHSEGHHEVALLLRLGPQGTTTESSGIDFRLAQGWMQGLLTYGIRKGLAKCG